MTAGRDDAARREAEAARVLAVIRAEAARRTGWRPVMTEMAGYAANGPDWAEQAEELDRRRARYATDDACRARKRAAGS